jgi:hypothetical protein
MMGKLQRTRGATTEREIANYLSEQLGTVVQRKLGQARDSGEDISVPPFRIEVKRRKGFAGMKFMEQCETGAGEDEIPIAIVRVDGDKRPVVMIRLDQFVSMMRDVIIVENNNDKQ